MALWPRRSCACAWIAFLFFAACADDDDPPAPQPDAGLDAATPDAATPDAATPDAGVDPIPGLTIDNYPDVDGSTSTFPLALVIACELLGLDWEWQPGLGSEGEAGIWPMPRTPDEEVLAAAVLQHIVHNKTHEAYLNLIGGAADLILVASPPSPDERTAAEDAGVTLAWQPLARDGLVIVANEANAVEDLSTEDIQGIFAGDVTRWSEVGGQNVAIHPYVRPVNSGSQQLFEAIVMQGRPMGDWPEDRQVQGMGALIDRIATDPLAIGYSVYYFVTFQYRAEGYRILSVDGTSPTADTLGDESYPFVAPVLVVTREDLDPAGLAAQLRDWLLTAAGQRVVGFSGYVPVVQPTE